jgi:hypothetical protein
MTSPARRVPILGGEHGLPAGTRPTTRIAAIDLGSNPIHLVVVEVSDSGGFHVVAGEKEMIRLGAGTDSPCAVAHSLSFAGAPRVSEVWSAVPPEGLPSRPRLETPVPAGAGSAPFPAHG